MRAIQRINNNAAICEDRSGRQLVALGRGVGFGELPREISLKDVQRTFYGIDSKYLSFIEEVDPDVLEFAAQFSDIVTQQVSYELSANLPITLADHFQFAIKRAREHIVVSMPFAGDVELTHPVEYKLGEMAVNGLKRTFKVRMPRDEAAGVALSIVNAMVSPSERRLRDDKRADRMTSRAFELVEKTMGVEVDRSSFAATRFATHVRYLFQRLAEHRPLESGNAELYDLMAEQYPRTTACAQAIGDEILRTYGQAPTKEELVYLIMHINRIAPVEGVGADGGEPDEER